MFTKTAAFVTAGLLYAAPIHAQGLAPAAADPASAKPGLLAKIGLDQKIADFRSLQRRPAVPRAGPA